MVSPQPPDPGTLLRAAPGRVRSVRAAVVFWTHPERLAQAWSRHGSASATPAAPPAGQLPGAPHEATVRYWVALPDRAREEHATGTVTAQRGGRWWQRAPDRPPRGGEVDPDVGPTIAATIRNWLDPAPLVPLLELAAEGREEVAGRESLRVGATPRAGHADDFELHRLGYGADRYELSVDLERGVLLGAAAFVGDEPFRTERALEIAFDEPLDDRLFEPDDSL